MQLRSFESIFDDIFSNFGNHFQLQLFFIHISSLRFRRCLCVLRCSWMRLILNKRHSEREVFYSDSDEKAPGNCITVSVEQDEKRCSRNANSAAIMRLMSKILFITTAHQQQRKESVNGGRGDVFPLLGFQYSCSQLPDCNSQAQACSQFRVSTTVPKTYVRNCMSSLYVKKPHCSQKHKAIRLEVLTSVISKSSYRFGRILTKS